MRDVLGHGVDVEFSWRYGVMGWYKDRELPLLRVYPCPFARVTVTWGFHQWADRQTGKR